MPPNDSNLCWKPEIWRYLKTIAFQEIHKLRIVRTRDRDLTWVIDFQRCLASLALRTYWQKRKLFNGYNKSFVELLLYIKYVLLKTNYRSHSYDLTPFAQPWWSLGISLSGHYTRRHFGRICDGSGIDRQDGLLLAVPWMSFWINVLNRQMLRTNRDPGNAFNGLTIGPSKSNSTLEYIDFVKGKKNGV